MSTAEVTREGPAGPADALGWIRRALWTPDADVDLVPVDARDPRATWLARDAELLVPLGSRRAAAGVSRRFWDGMPATRRARQWLGEAALRTGAAQRLWSGRVALVGADADLDDPDRSLLARLAVLLDCPRVLAAITARPTQYNGKPVVMLFDPDGTPLAFAKVAVDDATERYVRTEVEWLQRAATAEAPLRAPALLASCEWQGRPVAVCEPLPLPRLPRRPVGVADAIARLGEVVDAPLAERGPVARADTELADLVATVHGDAVVRFGAWHGDLSPWNTATRGGRVLVWDWEMAGDDMPLGSDLRHARVMVATHLGGRSAVQALAGLDVTDPATAAYLLELTRRDDQHGLGLAAADRLRELAR